MQELLIDTLGLPEQAPVRHAMYLYIGLGTAAAVDVVRETLGK